MTPEAIAEIERVRRLHGDEAAAVAERFIAGPAKRRPTNAPNVGRKVGRREKAGAGLAEVRTPGWVAAGAQRPTPPPAGDLVWTHGRSRPTRGGVRRA